MVYSVVVAAETFIVNGPWLAGQNTVSALDSSHYTLLGGNRQAPEVLKCARFWGLSPTV